MAEYLIANGRVVTLGETDQVIEDGAIHVKDGKVEQVGKTEQLKRETDCPVRIDAENQVVMPGFICAHHHLYSTMARGFAPPGEPAYTFEEILERLWWKLDRALTEEAVRYSAYIPLIECIRNGTTTFVDHHASPSCRNGSLDILADTVEEAGLRASLCYEVSDRNKEAAGVEENRRFLDSLEKRDSDFLQGMVGIHASLTVSDETLARCREVADEFDVGYHSHVAEGIEDQEDSLEKYGQRTVERLVERDICGEDSLFIHCVNIDENEMDLIEETGTNVVHNPESNMNNAVGVAPVLEMMDRGITVGLGTDGMASDMPSQMRCAHLLHQLDKSDPRVAFVEAPEMMLRNNAKITNRFFPVELGKIEPGAAADFAIMDYSPPTEFNGDTFLGHLIYGLVDATVDTTVVDGQILMENKELAVFDEPEIAARCRELTSEVWDRIE